MTCASCVNRIERYLNKIEGVESASVNLATESASVRCEGSVLRQGSNAHYLHTIATLTARTSSRFLLLVNTYGKTATTHAESGMRYQHPFDAQIRAQIELNGLDSVSPEPLSEPLTRSHGSGQCLGYPEANTTTCGTSKALSSSKNAGAGFVPVRRTADGPAFVAPPLTRIGDVEESLVQHIASELRRKSFVATLTRCWADKPAYAAACVRPLAADCLVLAS